MFKQDQLVRDTIAEAIRSIADAVVREHRNGITQEPQITARVGQSLETQLNDTSFGRFRVRVVSQDMPDRGPNSLEHRGGADIYIGVEVHDGGSSMSKGLFIQSKSGSTRSADELARLHEQCEKMVSRSPQGSFVWIYTSSGIDVIPAMAIVNNPGIAPGELQARNVREQFVDVLDCISGDGRFRLPEGENLRQALGAMMKEFGAQRGVAISLEALHSQLIYPKRKRRR